MNRNAVPFRKAREISTYCIIQFQLTCFGKLQNGIGDFAGARKTFLAVAATVSDTAARAEAEFNAYRSALEEKKWDEALHARSGSVHPVGQSGPDLSAGLQGTQHGD